MGLLDDAIREHLDLKRRHGASDDEIAQKEAEALGPARREFPRTAEEDLPHDGEPAHVEDESMAHTIGDPLAEEIAEPPVFDPLAAEPEASVEPAPPPAPVRGAELADTEEYRFEDDDELDEDDDEDGYGDDDDDLDLDDDDLELDDDDDDDDDDDVLGDTPDFLQDTPEHDKLWFEQKPPRDFDFE
jgi:hypothetical protein